MVSDARHKQLQKHLNLTEEELTARGILRIHPSFRIIATSHQVDKTAADYMELFHFHNVPPLSKNTAQVLFSSLGICNLL